MVEILKILYGTETGNAQDLSERLWQKCQSQRICAQCCAIDYYDMQVSPDHLTSNLLKRCENQE
jgi:sulfite reductase alpha subunit-like flavoprotein